MPYPSGYASSSLDTSNPIGQTADESLLLSVLLNWQDIQTQVIGEDPLINSQRIANTANGHFVSDDYEQMKYPIELCSGQ